MQNSKNCTSRVLTRGLLIHIDGEALMMQMQTIAAVHPTSDIRQRSAPVQTLTATKTRVSSSTKRCPKAISTSSCSESSSTKLCSEMLMVKTNPRPSISASSTTATKSLLGPGIFSTTLACTKESSPSAATSA